MYLPTSGGLGCVGCGCPGMGCADCGGTCGGRRGVQGLGTIDLSTLSWEDYLLIGIAGAFIWNLAAPDSRAFNPGPSRPKRRGKKSSGTGSALSAAAVVLAVVGGGYLLYSQINS